MDQDTRDRLDIYRNLLLKWQKSINLISKNTVEDVDRRHFLDSMQVSALVPNARLWVDIGTGAGFPGLVTAIGLIGIKSALVHLVESDQRKCAFLREVSRETGAPTLIHNCRIEEALPQIGQSIEAISARAVAPLKQLIDWTASTILAGAVAVFPKGREVAAELAQLDSDDRFCYRLVPSQTDATARIVIVTKNENHPGNR